MPERIISLTPSLTEILFALESGPRVVGVTDSCDYPAVVGDLPNVGCWFDPDMAKLLGLKPDLVLGLQTAHRQVEPERKSHGIRFILVNPLSVEGTIADIARIGEILGTHEVSERLVSALGARLATIDAGVGNIAGESKQTACRILDMDEGRFHVAGVPIRYHHPGRRPECNRLHKRSLSQDHFGRAAGMGPAGDI